MAALELAEPPLCLESDGMGGPLVIHGAWCPVLVRVNRGPIDRR